jgi:hypothetical protein
MGLRLQQLPSGLVIFRFPAAWLQPYARPIAPGSRSYQRVRGSYALGEVPGAIAALDGSMYDDLGGGRADLNFLISGPGILDPGDFDTRGVTANVLRDGQVSWRRGAGIASGARVSVQLYPSLVESGRNVQNPRRDTDSNWRAALVEFAPGELAFALQRAPMHEFANALIREGAVWAGYTDGGGSARVLIRDAAGSITRFGSSEDRAVPMWLLVQPRAAQSAEPTQGTILALLVAVLLAFAAWTTLRNTRFSLVTT